MRRGFCSLLLTALMLIAGPVAAAELVGGYPPDRALRLGERMYREGLLPSGEPMEALVQGDIPVSGTMFSCQSCHLRSGLGSVEGTIVTPPVNAVELFQDYTKAPAETLPQWQEIPSSMRPPMIRPAYTDETLARVIWTGVDSAGREISLTMPRYLLDEADMEVLVYYLRHLSARPSPGVTSDTIRFATVIAGDVPAGKAKAMVATLEAYFRDRNLPTRRQKDRARRGVFYRKHILTAWRRLELEVWRLEGDPQGWEDQLARLYAQSPVFALVGGLAAGDWEPIHRFCERMRLPCLFPLTERPVISERDWYTLYFSRGDYQEGETLARYLAGKKGDGRKLVVLRENGDRTKRVLLGFGQTWERLAGEPVSDIAVTPEDLAQMAPLKDGIVICAVTDRLLPRLFDLVRRSSNSLFYLFHGVSPGLAKKLPADLRPVVRMTYPYRLPEAESRYRRLVSIWLRGRGLKMTYPHVQTRCYFIGWMLSGVLMHLQSDYYRDFLLDIFDMMNDETYAIVDFPRLSFGQGQRYAAKGCYVVGFNPEDGRLQVLTDWVIH
ncbi:amino acid/amide ABC transporter substrate-binding protein (HAAT family) [Geothermobacter ehrlichii]|uniref:Amino acid/amide ABC transporter substrate-binding protein (HAAT family) n=1 Tax=Geothermobacter ehrlichii TaxID=213224 RepID=A0A5D3WG22_9BACT|nr:ABC transporter substrate-binding protein [Geothermobacter ehrlichii]TYO97105.1 amino acid/amide ABC transporter substrate-binding protein (HAAT family) [Geothermobacter ehrlichii]